MLDLAAPSSSHSVERVRGSSAGSISFGCWSCPRRGNVGGIARDRLIGAVPRRDPRLAILRSRFLLARSRSIVFCDRQSA